MLEEARAAPACVASQLTVDEASFRGLGAALRAKPPTGIVTLARGSSDHAASYLGYLTMARFGRLVTSLPMSLVTLYHAPLASSGMLALAVSQSGRSPDLVEPIQVFRRGNATTVALVNDTSSTLAAAAECVIALRAGAERSIAATKSFICALVAGARLVAHWSENQELLRGLGTLPKVLETACALDWTAATETLAKAERLMVIGRGMSFAIALEAALKLKETCGIQAEAFSAAEVRHGPMALVGSGYPLLILATRGPALAELVSLAKEMRARRAAVILAAPSGVEERDLTIVTAEVDDLDPIAAIQSFYLMVEGVARARGQDPDRPPLLSKVTMTL
jgi:glucosamine--fructose-6-phosphate aminotransferase (isomerizing)